MIKVDYKLDYSLTLDESELLGDILIIGSDDRSISQKDTFIDSWLIGLSEGLQLIKYVEKGSIDIPEEPSLLTFNRSTKTLKFGKQVIFVNSFELMEAHLYGVIEKFVLDVNSKKTDGTIAILKKILEQKRFSPKD